MTITREKLINQISSYDESINLKLINKAIDLAIEYHGNQKRASGDYYYQHPIEVAYIVAKMKLDQDSLITALLHDTIEDTNLSLNQIKKIFGEQVANLVIGVTKLSKLEFQSDNLRQAENFRKLFIAMSEDIRVLLIKLADRLHNMRTLKFLPSEERRIRIAKETMDIYAPLAERIGIQEIKLELHDLSFKALYPNLRQPILDRLVSIFSNGQALVNEIINDIEKLLKEANINALVSGRQKTPFSIWMKMKQKNVGFEQLSDIIAFRIIVNDLLECYQSLGVIHSHYQMIPDHFQDFISTPKLNGYQSLHTVVIGPQKQRIEIQIRTNQMHEIAEWGVAAHWSYKQKCPVNDGKQYKWMRELLSILETNHDAEEFLQNTKLAISYHQIFCFTPKGDLIALPLGATSVDFAYAVHSDVGNSCVGAKINSRIMPLKTILKNGDQVEILTSKNQTPSPAWEEFVVTGKARSEIRKFNKDKQKHEYITSGKNIFDKIMKSASVKWSAINTANLLNHFKKNDLDDLCYNIGYGSLHKDEILNYFTNINKKINNNLIKLFNNKKTTNSKDNKNKLPIAGLIDGISVHYAGCCHPLPGDKIIGIINSGVGVTIHKNDCDILLQASCSSNQLIKIDWDIKNAELGFSSRIQVILPSNTKHLESLTSVVAKAQANIINFKIVSKTDDIFNVIVDLEVKNLDHLESVIKSLKSASYVTSVERVKL